MSRRRTNGIAPRPELFDAESFDGFGPSRFHPNEEAPGAHRIRVKSLKDLREKVRTEAPKRPGVYAMLNANGRVAKAASAGVIHFLSKPYTAETLLSTIRRALEG